MTTHYVFMALADRPLLDEAKRLATAERRATAALLRALMEIDARRLYLGEGCASMFTYCTQVLHLAEGAAHNRIEAARAAARFPLILDLFERSAITLTAVRLLSPHLTANNHADALASARHKSKPDILAIIAALCPKPDAPVVIRKLPAPRMTAPVLLSAAAETRSPAVADAAPTAARPATGAETSTPTTTSVAVPLASERYRIQLTVSRETHDKFRRAQDLLRHALPSGDAAAVVDRALTLLIADLERKRFATTSRPRVGAHAASSSRQIPAAVRRAVSQRDEGRCRFVGTSGRCRETSFLEFHHVEPFAVGGAATVDNIELRCRAHNLYEARLSFGDSVVREERASWVAPSWNSFWNESASALKENRPQRPLVACGTSTSFG